MRKFASTARQPAVRTAVQVLAVLPALFFALATFAQATAIDAGTADTGGMEQPLWQYEAHTLDDLALSKIHGRGIFFLLVQPEIIPAVILWDESGKKRGGGTGQDVIRINVSSATAQTR